MVALVCLWFSSWDGQYIISPISYSMFTILFHWLVKQLQKGTIRLFKSKKRHEMPPTISHPLPGLTCAHFYGSHKSKNKILHGKRNIGGRVVYIASHKDLERKWKWEYVVWKMEEEGKGRNCFAKMEWRISVWSVKKRFKEKFPSDLLIRPFHSNCFSTRLFWHFGSM